MLEIVIDQYIACYLNVHKEKLNRIIINFRWASFLFLLRPLPYRTKFCRRKWRIFLKRDEIFFWQINSPDKFSPIKIIKICLNDFFPCLASLVLELKTLLVLMGEMFRRAKVTTFSFDDEIFSRQIILPAQDFAL